MVVTPEAIEKTKKLVQDAIDKCKENKDWSIKSVNGLIDTIQIVLTEVEKLGKAVEGMTGQEKKDLAVEIINKQIDIPFLPEFVEAKLISQVIDIVVGYLNKWFGKAWLGKAPDKAVA